MKPAAVALATCALSLFAAAPAGAETVVAGVDGEISYYVSNENFGQRKHNLVRPDGATGELGLPTNLPNGPKEGAPFQVDISPDGGLLAYRQSGGVQEGRLAVRRTEGGTPHTLATAGPAPRESGKPHFDATIIGVSFSLDGRRVAVSTMDDDTKLETYVLTLGVLVDDPPNPVPPPHKLGSDIAGVNWRGDEILAGTTSGHTVAYDAETYAFRGQVAAEVARTVGPHGELIGLRSKVGTPPFGQPGTTSETDVVRVDTGEVLYDGEPLSMPEDCDLSGSCPEHEQVWDAIPAPSGKGYVVVVNRWNRFNDSFERIELHDENRDFVRLLAPEQSQFTNYDLQNWIADPLPVVFVHGFLGSEITCDGTEDGDDLWPSLPFPPFERFRLQPDGLSSEGGAGTCPGAGPTKLLETAALQPVYEGVANWLRGMDDVDASFLAWDWRKRPQESIDALDEMIEAARERAGTDRVQLIAHSYGGLLARVYANTTARRDKLARVVTLGTPYWGAVKSSFPLISGEEMIGGGDLDPALEQDELQRFARNLGGLYHLWPSSSFGPWLNTGQGFKGSGAIDPQVEVFGGQPALLAQGQSLHASTLDSFSGIGGLDWTVLAGASTPTPVSLTLTPDGGGADLEALVAFDDGDGTVPLRSATLDATTARRVVRACGVKHVPLPNDAGVQARLLPWLRTGAPVADAPAACPATGWHVEVHGVDLPTNALTNAAVRGGDGLADLELAGKLDVFAFGDDLNVVVPAGPALTVPLDAPGATVELTPLTGKARGQTREFPALPAGVRELRIGASGAEPTLDGKVAPNAPKPAGGGTPTTPPPAGGGTQPPPPAGPAADRLAPRTTAKVKRLRGGRFKVTLRARDRGGSGVARITYRVGKKGKLKRYRRPFTLRKKQLKQLRIGAVDRAGNKERLRLVRR